MATCQFYVHWGNIARDNNRQLSRDEAGYICSTSIGGNGYKAEDFCFQKCAGFRKWVGLKIITSLT